MRKNTIAIVIQWIGWINVSVGILGSFIMGYVAENWTITFIGMFISIVSGVMLLGFSEIINLIQLSVYKTEKMMKILSKENAERAED